jgi:transposase
MKLYGAIDLHSNNNVTVLIDEKDKVVYQKRLANDLPLVIEQLSPYASSMEGIVVESTYNWYWLVDGLMEKGHRVHLANTAAIQQYEGLKYTDDDSDARWLAHLFRLGVLPEGYIYPKEERAVRDLLRKRSQLVHHKTAHLLSIQNLYSRNTGVSLSANRIKQLTSETVDARFSASDLALAIKANLSVMRSLETEITVLERVVKERIKLKPTYRYLLTVSGIRRFPKVGNFVSYCRCVKSEKLSNGKRKGSGNTKNGNKYLSWAFVEAANFAIRYEPLVARFYQRKKAKRHRVVALKAVANKLARACYYVMRDEVPFDVARAFA